MMMNIPVFCRRLPVFFALSLLMMVSFKGYSQRWVEEHAKAVITPYMIGQTAGNLASVALKGSITPATAIDSVAGFIARQFEVYGLTPLKGSYFQDLQYCYFSLGDDIFLSVVKDLETKNYEPGRDYIPYDFSGSKPAEGEIVFAGYGITAPEYNYDDYKNIDVQGKIVAILQLEPGQTDSSQTLFKGRELTRYSGLKEKQRMAADHGAAGVMVISGPLNFSSLRPAGFRWPSLNGNSPADTLPLRYCAAGRENIPVVSVGESLINELFGCADTLRRLQQHIEHDMQPHSFVIPGKTIAMNISLSATPAGGRNVVGFLQGSDPVLKDEVVVVAGHYDHSSIVQAGKTETGYSPGNAGEMGSGTCSLLAVASAFGSMPMAPKRSVVFIAFGGDEKRLLGSATYMHYPLLPLEKTAAMFNMDMISGNNPDSLGILGAMQNPDLMKIIRKQNKSCGFLLAEGDCEKTGHASDRNNFSARGISSLFFSAGLSANLTGAAGGSDGVNPEKAARAARLVFLTSWSVAGEGRHYKIVK